MSDTYKTNCEICETEFELPNYDNGTCPKCGTEYRYDEGHSIVLTQEMHDAIRKVVLPPEEIDRKRMLYGPATARVMQAADDADDSPRGE